MKRLILVLILCLMTKFAYSSGLQGVSGTIEIKAGTITTANVKITDPAPAGGMLPSHPYVGCSVAVFSDTAATTTATVIPYVTGQRIYVFGITYFNRSTTAGDVNFLWGSTVCYPAAVSGSIGAGFVSDVYLTDNTYAFRVTTPGACGITVFYKQY